MKRNHTPDLCHSSFNSEAPLSHTLAPPPPAGVRPGPGRGGVRSGLGGPRPLLRASPGAPSGIPTSVEWRPGRWRAQGARRSSPPRRRLPCQGSPEGPQRWKRPEAPPRAPSGRGGKASGAPFLLGPSRSPVSVVYGVSGRTFTTRGSTPDSPLRHTPSCKTRDQ